MVKFLESRWSARRLRPAAAIPRLEPGERDGGSAAERDGGSAQPNATAARRSRTRRRLGAAERDGFDEVEPSRAGGFAREAEVS
jgi:hypothetical protein